MEAAMRLTLVATGGTIASRSTAGGLVAAATGAELLAVLGPERLPGGTQVRAIDIGLRASYALTLDDMHTIARAVLDECRAGAAGVVVTHGTDSLEETAFLIDLLHEGDTPVVVTGAQRPFDAPDGDGPGNLAHALGCAAASSHRGAGVLVAFDGKLMPARGVRKVSSVDLAAFANESGRVSPTRARSALPGAAARMVGESLARVSVVAAVPGGTGEAIRDAASHRPAGIVLQALGIGNVSIEDAAAVGDVVASGVPVVVTSRVWGGPVRPVYGNGGGKALEEAGAVFAGDLSTWQARVLLSVCLTLDGGAGGMRALADWIARCTTR